MTAPTPRPALRKAADAHVHPAAPGHSTHQLRHASELPSPRPDLEAISGAASEVEPSGSGKSGRKGHRLSGPPTGTTSDMLRAAGKAGRRQARGLPVEKSVELTVKVPTVEAADWATAIIITPLPSV